MPTHTPSNGAAGCVWAEVLYQKREHGFRQEEWKQDRTSYLDSSEALVMAPAARRALEIETHRKADLHLHIN